MAAKPRRHTTLGARAFRALLVLYPAAFRDEYGREMALVFADRHRDAAGPVERAWLWLEVVAGILTEAPKEHIRRSNRLSGAAGFDVSKDGRRFIVARRTGPGATRRLAIVQNWPGAVAAGR